MNRTTVYGLPWTVRHCLRIVLLIISASPLITTDASASVLGAPEEDYWSDMFVDLGASIKFDATTNQLTISSRKDSLGKDPWATLELGEQFGPSNEGTHYGPVKLDGGGNPLPNFAALGLGFKVSLSLTGVVINPATSEVTDGGSFKVLYQGGWAGGLGDDYGGLAKGDVLLEGKAVGILLDARGSDTLDVELKITGGILQSPHPDPSLNGVVFAWNNQGLIRMSGIAGLPSDFSAAFELNADTMNVFGLPEATSFLVYAGLIAVTALLRPKQCPGLTVEHC